MKKLPVYLMSFVLAILLISGMENLIAPPQVLAWTPPSYWSETTVDGYYIDEWDLTDDFFADMYRAGKTDKPLESKAYLRYDCVPNTLYVLVLTEPGVPALAAGWESSAWAAIGSISNKVYTGMSGNDGIPPDFAWVGLSGDGLYASGYEASFQLDPGDWKIIIHIEVLDDSASQTSATIGFPKELIDLNIVCEGEHPLAIHVNKYVSLDNQASWVEVTIPPGPTVVEDTDLYFKFVITNSVNITLYNITLDDTVYDLSGISPPLPSYLDPDASYNGTIGPITANTTGQRTNRATTTGADKPSGGRTVSESQDLYYIVIPAAQEDPAITVQKYVSVDDLTYLNEPPWPAVGLGAPVWFKFVVTNSGNVTLDAITLDDSEYEYEISDNISPPLPSPFTLDPGDSYTGVIGPIYEEAGEYTDIATAVGSYDSATYSSTDNATFLVNRGPTTTTTLLSPPGPITLGQTVQDKVTISAASGGILPDASGNWTVEASQDIDFISGVIEVQTGSFSGPLPFIFTTEPWEPPSVGIWYFKATYSGDTNYEGSHSTPANERLVVVSPSSPTPTIPSTAVGILVYRVDKISLLVPWIALAAAIVTGGIILLRRRRIHD